MTLPLIKIITGLSSEPGVLGSVEFDRSLDELGIIELLRAVIQRLAFQRECGVRIDLLLVAGMAMDQRPSQKQTRNQILDRHC